MKKKRLLIHTGNVSIGGQEKMLIEFLKVLPKELYDINLCIEENKGEENYLEKFIPENVKYEFLTDLKLMEKLKHQQNSSNPILKLFYSINLKRKKKIAIKKLNKKLRPGDILIDYDMGLLRYIDKLNLNEIISVGWSHAGLGEKLKNKKKDKNMGKYNYIVAINKSMKAGYINNYGDRNIKFECISNFIDNDLIKEMGNEKIPEKNLGNYLLSVGSLTENKNHMELIKGFERYIREYNNGNINLVILGEGKERVKLEEYILDRGLEERVFLLGNKSNPYMYMKNSIGYIHSSKAESFALVLLETMIFSKVVIGKRNIGVKMVLENGTYGVILDDLNEELGETLNNIYSSEKRVRELEKLAGERAEYFQEEKIKVKEFIKKICYLK